MKIFSRKLGLLVSAAALGSVAGMPLMAAEPFQEVQGLATKPDFVSRSTDTRLTTVIVLLSGESVAAVQGRAGRKLLQGERDTVINARRADHASLRPQIERHGGHVIGGLHSALNGVKVRIAHNRIAELRRLPGVVDIKMVGTYERNNSSGVPLIGAPLAWQAAGHFQGQGIKIAIVDTGIDYTHANFGGPGTVAAYNAAKATNTAPADPALFGPAAAKVKGGIDLVGDNYNGANTPVQDPNPLDCPFNSASSGHGSHVAGTAAGFGVKSDGSTFHGPYNAAAYTPGAFRIGPGVAPMADLYAVRVFGCSGNTNVVAEAIDWAVAHGMDVISMSLGSNFGNVGNADAGNSAEQAAVASAANAGILVVAASGNAGPTPYITSAPAVFPGAISVAATDALAGVPTASLALSSGASITVQNSNSGVFANASSWGIVVLRNGDGTVSRGCNPDEYDSTKNGGIDITGKLVVTVRGTCARVFRAGAGQHFGAAAVAMINTAAGFPAYEGPISGGAATPGDGNIYEPVTIPFFGVLQADTTTLTGPVSGPAPALALANNSGILANANYLRVASFSSAGPRIGDSVLRPGVTAPGVSTVSTASGTGSGFSVLSGTSMATPAVAGVAALVRQANPTWPVADQRAAVIQTASPTLMRDYSPRNEGAGLVQAQSATATQAVVRTPDESISFGYADLLTDFSATKQVTVHNAGPKAVQFNISVTKTVGPASATVTTPASVIVAGNSDAQFPVTLNVPASSVGGTFDGSGNSLLQDIGGYVKLTPSNSRLNGNVSLSVPYYLAAHSRSNLQVAPSANALSLSNPGGAIAGTPSFYSWGLSQPAPQAITQADVRAVGTRLSGSTVVFGINTHGRMSTGLAFQEFDICIDTSGGPGFTPDKVLIGINGTALSLSATVANKFVSGLFPADANCNTTGGGSIVLSSNAATDNSVLLMGASRASLGLTAAQPRFKYVVIYYGTDGIGAVMPGVGFFNAFTPAITFAGGGSVAPNGAAGATVGINGEIANTPALGVMVVTQDNLAGASQAKLVPIAAVSGP